MRVRAVPSDLNVQYVHNFNEIWQNHTVQYNVVQ